MRWELYACRLSCKYTWLVYTKNLIFFRSTQSGDESVIRYVDFCESPRELSQKSRGFVCVSFGWCVRHAARVPHACGLQKCGDWSHALPVVGNAIDEKLEACEVSSPHQFRRAQSHFQDVGQEVRPCNNVPSHQAQGERWRRPPMRAPTPVLHVLVSQMLHTLACAQAMPEHELPLGSRREPRRDHSRGIT